MKEDKNLYMMENNQNLNGIYKKYKLEDCELYIMSENYGEPRFHFIKNNKNKTKELDIDNIREKLNFDDLTNKKYLTVSELNNLEEKWNKLNSELNLIDVWSEEEKYVNKCKELVKIQNDLKNQWLLILSNKEIPETILNKFREISKKEVEYIIIEEDYDFFMYITYRDNINSELNLIEDYNKFYRLPKYEKIKFQDLKGKFITSVERVGDEEIIFNCKDGDIYKLYHEQDCCEIVEIEDIIGDLDDLVNSEILLAEERTDSVRNDDGSMTWTFYTIRTHKTSIDIRWIGESNGYYSERVDLVKVNF